MLGVNWSRDLDWNSGNQRSMSGSVWSDWSWSVSRGWRRGIGNGFSNVFNISNVTGVSVSDVIGDNLGAAIGKGNTVSSVGGVSVPVLVGSKVNTVVAVGNSVLVVICWWDISVDRGRSVSRCRGISWGRGIGWSRPVDRGRCVLRSSGSHSQKSRQSNKALKIKKRS